MGGRARLLQALIVLVVGATVLILWGRWTNARETALAIGPPSEAQRQFFVSAADRPDIAGFFKDLPVRSRVKMAQNIGRYPSPETAALIGKLLGDFSPEARAALQTSLAEVAAKFPAAVAKELTQTGSFQLTAVFAALKSLGDRSLPVAAAELDVADARVNAARYLIEFGPGSASQLMEKLQDSDKDVRLAVVDALGKVKARVAVPVLLQKLGTKLDTDESTAVLTALATIGDPRAEPVLQQAIQDRGLADELRMQAALGLGRIGTPTAIKTLVPFASSEDLEFQEAAIEALGFSGENGLEAMSGHLAQQAAIAQHIQGAVADGVILKALGSDDVQAVRAGAAAAVGREALSAALLELLRKAIDQHDGVRIDAIALVLRGTASGTKLLEASGLEKRSGLVARRLIQ